MKNPGIKRPFFPLPDLTPVTDYTCVQLSIPDRDDYRLALASCLDMLTHWYSWERDSAQSGAATAAIWKEVINNIMWFNACGQDTRVPLTRVNADGSLEVSYDDGETWNAAPELDPRVTSIVAPPKSYPGGTDIPCATAENIVQSIQASLDAALSDIGAGASIVTLIAGIMAFAATVLSGGTLAPLATGLASSLINFGVSAIEAAFTSQVWIDFRCLVLANMPSGGLYDQSAVDDLYADIATEFTGIVVVILQSYVALYGPVGLTNAGRVGSGDGDECGACDEFWCYTWDFTVSNGGWTSATGYSSNYVAGQGWTWGDVNNKDRVFIKNNWPTSGTYTSVEIEISAPMNGNVNYYYFCNNANIGCGRQTFDNFSEPLIYGRTGLNFTTNIISLGFEQSSNSPGVPFPGYIKRVTLRGTGVNPFGTDNC